MLAVARGVSVRRRGERGVETRESPRVADGERERERGDRDLDAQKRKVSRRRGNVLGATVASVQLVSADPLRHVLQDRGAWGASSAMYREGCPHGDVRCLSAVGWTFLLFTYAGFACIIFGSLWSADALGKLSREWRRRTRGDGDGAV